jgi:DNA invertase Pin-like site-specific DNA recombinase
MKRDGRRLDHQTLEEIRRMAVQRVREGEKPAEVIAAYGFNRTSIYRWLNRGTGTVTGTRCSMSIGSRSLSSRQHR